MSSGLGFIHFLSLSVWVGGLLFLLGIVIPTLAHVLSDDLAESVGRHMMRTYYIVAGVCAVGAVGSLMGMVGTATVLLAWPRLALLLGMSILTGFDGWFVEPRIKTLRQEIPDTHPDGAVQEQASRLARLQRATIQIEGLVLLLGLLNLWLSVGGPA